MIRNFRLGLAAAAAALVLASCAEEQTESYAAFEDKSLEAWMTQHHPELLENYQEFGEAGYYIDVLDPGHAEAAPISDTACWVKFDFLGRDLGGNIVLTRRAAEAKLAGTFTKYTHYVPFYRYCGEANTGLLEGTYLAMRNVQTLGEAYCRDRGFESREVQLREGAKVVLYCPSRIVGEVSGDGGYEGQYSLSSGKPIRIELEIRDTVKNPLEAEGSAVDKFCRDNGGLQVYSSEENPADGAVPMPAGPDDARHPYKIAERWVSACDSVPQVYVDLHYLPGRELTFPEVYAAGVEPYVSEASMISIEARIAEALRKRFHGDDGTELYADVADLEADSVGLDGKAKIWYIGRFLDGFVFDTNIDEVKEIVYGEVNTKGTALSYTPSEGGMIQAFYYTIPNLKYGQWATLVTVSTQAYGASGKNGSTETQTSSSGYSSSYYDYLNYLSYANSYYGSSYGGYYPGYYGGYYGGMYDPYYGYGYNYNYYNNYYGNTGTDTETTTTTQTTTEILPFTPLLFQLYIEPAEE